MVAFTFAASPCWKASENWCSLFFLLAIFCWHLHRSFCCCYGVVRWWEWQIRRLSNTKLTAFSWPFSFCSRCDGSLDCNDTLPQLSLPLWWVVRASWGHPYCIALTCRKTSFAAIPRYIYNLIDSQIRKEVITAFGNSNGAWLSSQGQTNRKISLVMN